MIVTGRWINNRKNIAFTPACQAATHLLSLPVSGTDPSQAEDKYNLHSISWGKNE